MVVYIYFPASGGKIRSTHRECPLAPTLAVCHLSFSYYPLYACRGQGKLRYGSTSLLDFFFVKCFALPTKKTELEASSYDFLPSQFQVLRRDYESIIGGRW